MERKLGYISLYKEIITPESRGITFRHKETRFGFGEQHASREKKRRGEAHGT